MVCNEVPYIVNRAGYQAEALEKSLIYGANAVDRSVSDCLDAAMNIASIVNELAEGRQMFRVFWVCHHYQLSRYSSPLIALVHSLFCILRRRCLVCLHNPTTQLPDGKV